MGCLYRITMPGPMVYIGATIKTAEQRWKVHAYEARRGTRGRLYSSIRKHGESAAVVETLVIADKWDYLCDLERKAIAAFNTRSPNGLNLTDGGDGASPGSAWHLGYKHSDETKAKMSADRKGRKVSEETKAKMSARLMGNKYNVGRVQSADERAMRSAAQYGISRGGSSGVLGVSWYAPTKKWRAHATVAHKTIHLGYHSTLEGAIAARKAFDAERTPA